MKRIVSVVAMLCIAIVAQSQKVEYKKNTIIVGGNNVATINVIKENLGLANTYEVLSMGGEKLIIAKYADAVDENPNDNMHYYYRVTFLTTNQVGIFTVSKLGAEKSFAKLIGKSGIIVNDKLDEEKVKEFIASEGKTPKATIDYTIVDRDRRWPMELKTGRVIMQDSKEIGTFTDATEQGSDKDTYNFMLPSGVLIAKVTFSGGNNAQNFEVTTMKDSKDQVIPIPSKEHVIASSSEVDRNQIVLKKIAQWLIDNQYL